MMKHVLFPLLGFPLMGLLLTAILSFGIYNQTSITFLQRKIQYHKLVEATRLLVELHAREAFLRDLQKTFDTVDHVGTIQECLGFFTAHSHAQGGLALISSRSVDAVGSIPSFGALNVTLKCRSTPLCNLIVEVMNTYPNFDASQWDLAPTPDHRLLVFNGTFNVLKLHPAATP